MKNFTKKLIVVLGFVLFFVLFPPGIGAGERIAASAKEVTEDADAQTETQAQIKLNVKTKALVKDVEYTLKIYNLSENQKATFKSNDPEVATVDENGVILGISNGTALISVTVKEDGKTVASLSCEVTVGPPAINVRLTKSEVLLVVGKRTTLKTILLPNNTTEAAKFYSSDQEVVSVSSTGKITAKAVGEAYVFAIIDNGKYDLCKVTVVDSETYQNLLDEVSSPEEPQESETEPEDSSSEIEEKAPVFSDGIKPMH